MTIVLIIAIVLYFVSSISLSVLLSVILDRVNLNNPLVVFIMSTLWILIIPGTAIYYVSSKNAEKDLERLFDFLGI